MKKYMIMCMALVAIVLSSCKNEEISIAREVRFEVRPYGVIADFVKHQVYEGDLETFYASDMLRVNLFVYDNKGELVASDKQYLTGYRSTMNTTFDLADGEYTVIATSDVTTMHGGEVSFEYWEFSGINRLSDLRIKDLNYVGSDDKILGVSYETITVASGNVNYSIKLEPAGALFVVQHNGIHAFSDVVTYELDVNKSSDFCSFADGGFQPIISEATTYNWKVDEIIVGNYPDYNNIYSYRFVLPLGNTDFEWLAILKEGYLYLDQTHNAVNIKQGKMYNCVFTIPSLTCEFYEFSEGKSMNVAGDLVRFRDTNKGSNLPTNVK